MKPHVSWDISVTVLTLLLQLLFIPPPCLSFTHHATPIRTASHFVKTRGQHHIRENHGGRATDAKQITTPILVWSGSGGGYPSCQLASQRKRILASLLPRSASPTNDPGSPSQSTTDLAAKPSLRGLNAAIVGAGPSGTLLAHRLLSAGASSVTVYEKRRDPRSAKFDPLEGRAYALGIGIRGRTAIRTVDEALWKTVKRRGYESERFRLHLTPKITLRLRDGPARRQRQRQQRHRRRAFWHLGRTEHDDDDDDDSKTTVMEPSLLLYQTDLCSALLDELERRSDNDNPSKEYEGNVTIRFQSRVVGVNVPERTIRVLPRDEDTEIESTHGPFDVIVGCDGVNSPVRKSIEMSAPHGTFHATVRSLPGQFKVGRLTLMPPKLDPTSVALLLPRGKGPSVTAFVEPIAEGGACVLFAGRRSKDEETTFSEDPILSSDKSKDSDTISPRDRKETAKYLLERFPLLEGVDLEDLAQQLLSQKSSVASSVKCNIYHFGCVVLCGDAAHATGGVSGQGVNSALTDSAVLSDCLEQTFQNTDNKNNEPSSGRVASIESALLSYSQRQVPEGWALYDLSFGPEQSVGWFKRIRFGLGALLDTIFGGRFGIGQPPIQTLLTTSLRSFADVRRDRDRYYGEKFPDAATFNETLSQIYVTNKKRGSQR